MKMKRIISWLILAALAASAVSCGNNTDTPNNETSNGGGLNDSDNTSEAESTGRDSVSDGLPSKNYNGATFTILDRTEYKYEFQAEEETGDLLNDAVYKRNLAVEERFNVKIETFTLDSEWGAQATQFNNTLRSSVMSSDSAFDLVAGYAATIPGLVSDNIFFNWNDLDYVDFSKPWWSELVSEELTINDKMYMITGDLSLALWKGMNCIFFNKKLADNYKIEDLYGIVNDGKWTFDTLSSLTKDVYQDIDGDGKQSDADFYGLVLGRSTEIDNLKEAFEINVTKKGSDGFPEIVLINERSIGAVEKLNSFIHGSNGAWMPEDDAQTKQRVKIYNAFFEGRAIFYTATLGKSEELRAMTDDFGILPYPKYDEDQKQYHSTSLDEFSLFLIPVDAKDPEMTAIITEALCAESYKKVVPIFYDTVLKTKAARDVDSAEMVDLIRDSLTFDFGYVHSDALGGVGHKFVNWIRENNNNISSDYDANKNTYLEKLDKVLEVYR
ncbi:MAG: hypothetical protein HFE63_00705 [Clostridiales bacterium]|nr:hypothetical protein [Clostridiales bacterium]